MKKAKASMRSVQGNRANNLLIPKVRGLHFGDSLIALKVENIISFKPVGIPLAV